MQTQVVLTSSQSKRLIAKGIAAWEDLRRAFATGIVAVAKGTTDSYIVEELTRGGIEKSRYVTGRITPEGVDDSDIKSDLDDFVFEKQKRLKGVSVNEIVSRMGPGDMFIKGANAINYGLEQAAIQIGHPTGGTLGATVGTIVSRKVRLVHPAGLEKNVPGDLTEAVRRLSQGGECIGPAYGLWVTCGELFTEIEAVEALFNLEAVPVGAGGILGAEGSVTLALFGDKGDLNAALEVIDEIQDEPPFGS